MTELHQAAAAGDLGEVEELLKQNKYGPNVRDIDWCNKTPLHWAAAQGHADVARVLIEHGARVSLVTVHGWTPAHYAAEFGRIGILHLLHFFHAPMDKPDFSGDKPLRIAQIYGHLYCVEFLRKAELECQAYRKKAAEEGICLDEKDEECVNRWNLNQRRFPIRAFHIRSQ